jgi:hypothetical protein
MPTSTLHLGISKCCKSTTWDQWLYFPSEGRRAENFFALKNPAASAGFEPVNLGTKGQHATPRPPKPLTHCLREGIQKSQTGPCSNQKSQKIIIIQGYRTYTCPLLESERCINEQGNFENWLFHMHFVCPSYSDFFKRETIAIESKVSATQYPFSSKERG